MSDLVQELKTEQIPALMMFSLNTFLTLAVVYPLNNKVLHENKQAV